MRHVGRELSSILLPKLADGFLDGRYYAAMGGLPKLRSVSELRQMSLEMVIAMCHATRFPMPNEDMNTATPT